MTQDPPVPVSVDASPVDDVVIISFGSENIGLPLDEALAMAGKILDSCQVIAHRRKKAAQ